MTPINFSGEGWMAANELGQPVAPESGPKIFSTHSKEHNEVKVRWTVTSIPLAHEMKSMLDEERETLSASALHDRIKQCTKEIRDVQHRVFGKDGMNELAKRIEALEKSDHGYGAMFIELIQIKERIAALEAHRVDMHNFSAELHKRIQSLEFVLKGMI